MSSVVRPVHKDNAIKELGFSIHLMESLYGDDDLLEKFPDLKESLMEYFDHFSLMPQDQFFTGQGSPIASRGSPIASRGSPIICFRNAKDDRKPASWRLRIEPDSISVYCLDYTRWRQVFVDMNEIVSRVLHAFRYSEAQIKTMVFECVDEFLADEDFPMEDLFSEDSRYYNPRLEQSSPKRWHLHQGWVDRINKNTALLNNLNINLEIINRYKAKATITHLIKIYEDPNGGCNHIAVEDFLKKAHGLNKVVIKNLLAAPMLDQIGMNS